MERELGLANDVVIELVPPRQHCKFRSRKFRDEMHRKGDRLSGRGDSKPRRRQRSAGMPQMVSPDSASLLCSKRIRTRCICLSLRRIYMPRKADVVAQRSQLCVSGHGSCRKYQGSNFGSNFGSARFRGHLLVKWAVKVPHSLILQML
jgi:hypothetical protein